MTENEILEAQQIWAKGVVEIGAASDWEGARNLAQDFVQRLYVTDGSLLFKPTKARDQQFRPTVTSAVSYFVGNNSSYPEDKGFALEPWSKVRFENAGMRIEPDGIALAMGNYFFLKNDGSEVKVEYTFGYKRFGDSLRIVLHHSALPFAG